MTHVIYATVTYTVYDIYYYRIYDICNHFTHTHTPITKGKTPLKKMGKDVNRQHTRRNHSVNSKSHKC